MLERLVLHIGLHKTGTTWLQRRAFTPAFGVHLLADSAKPWDDPLHRALVLGEGFDPSALRAEAERRWDSQSMPVLSAERFSGHPVSGAYDRWVIADRLCNTFPDAIILVGTRRDSSDWMNSIYAQMLVEGYTGRSLEPPRSSAWKTASWPGQYLEVDELLEGYRQRFGRGKVFELPYNDLRDRPEVYIAALAEACAHEAFRGLLALSGERQNPRPKNLERLRVANYFKLSALNPNPVLDLGPRAAACLARLLRPF